MAKRAGRLMTAEEKWCAACRRRVRKYLAGESVRHGRIGSWPAWHVAPYVSVWAVESQARPGWVGWWVISGDVPTDYESAARNQTSTHRTTSVCEVLACRCKLHAPRASASNL